MRNKILMTLALLLTAVTGTWAQTAFGVKEITADMLPASWSTDNSAVTADDLAKLGFMEVTYDEAKTWTGAPQKGTVRLIYTLCESANWVNGEGGYVSTYSSRKIFYSCLDGQRIFITTEITEWPLTPDADKKVWTLTNMPGSDVELQVEYYAESNLFLGKEALADKANISVLNGSTAVEFDDEGKSTTTVTEGNTVTAKFTGKKVLGMTVAKKAANVHSITIAVDPSTTDPIATAPAMTIEFKTGETWADVAARYDWLDTYMTYTVFYKDNILNGNVHDANGGVTPDKTIDPNGSYHWGL